MGAQVAKVSIHAKTAGFYQAGLSHVKRLEWFRTQDVRGGFRGAHAQEIRDGIRCLHHRGGWVEGSRLGRFGRNDRFDGLGLFLEIGYGNRRFTFPGGPPHQSDPHGFLFFRAADGGYITELVHEDQAFSLGQLFRLIQPLTLHPGAHDSHMRGKGS